MNTSYGFDHITNELTISKAFQKKASIYGTEEYKTVLAFRKDYPNLKIVVKTKKGNEKAADDRLTFTKMHDFIKLCANSDERLAVYDRVFALSKCQRSPYAYVKRWFLENYANYSENPEFVDGCVIPKTRAELEAEMKAKAADETSAQDAAA